jgi:predicted nucleic acid-binding protein
MNVVDSCGWLEFFGRGNLGEHYAPLICNTAELVVPTVCIYEVFKQIAVQRDEEEALKAMGWMSLGNVVDLTQDIALLAATLSMAHELPMADSMILATAQRYHAILWTQDDHFKGMDGVQFVQK